MCIDHTTIFFRYKHSAIFSCKSIMFLHWSIFSDVWPHSHNISRINYSFNFPYILLKNFITIQIWICRFRLWVFTQVGLNLYFMKLVNEYMAAYWQYLNEVQVWWRLMGWVARSHHIWAVMSSLCLWPLVWQKFTKHISYLQSVSLRIILRRNLLIGYQFMLRW